jgi:hypothetical protein
MEKESRVPGVNPSICKFLKTRFRPQSYTAAELYKEQLNRDVSGIAEAMS